MVERSQDQNAGAGAHKSSQKSASDSTQSASHGPSSNSLSGTPSNGGLGGLLRSLLGKGNAKQMRESFEELIEEAGERETPIDESERALIGNILKFGEMTAYDVMVPRADITGVDLDTPLEALVATMIENPHSRYPVYRESLDDILGMVHIKDVLAIAYAAQDGVPENREKGEKQVEAGNVVSLKGTERSNFSLRDVMRPTMIIAPSMRVLDLLLQMRLQRRHMAFVVDEYGGIDGLVTIEDLVEEIVGEIEDEHDTKDGPKIIAVPGGEHIAHARVDIDDLEEAFGPLLSDEERESDIDTLGGLVFTLAGRVPSRGELIRHEASGVEFEVLEADPRKIKRLRLRNLEALKTSDNSHASEQA